MSSSDRGPVSGGGLVAKRAVRRARPGPIPRERMLEIQRERIIDAMARVVGERGLRRTTVAEVVTTAGVSRVTFYGAFEDLDACFLGVLDSTMRRATARITAALETDRPWQERMLAGLAALLGFLDSDPLLARVCLVEALAAGPAALEYRVRELEVLKHLVDGVLAQAQAGRQAAALSAEAVVASVAGILHTRLVTGEAPPFLDLLGPLAAMVITPYVGTRPIAEELRRVERLARSLAQEHAPRPPDRVSGMEVPKVLGDPRGHRARLCLFYVAEHPGASNRAAADGIGLSHHGQISTLLGRLEHLGLLAKRAGGAGHVNEWWITPHGEQVAEALRDMY
jgi:AcrR family transcriptional regulator